ncbi:MAG: sensor domain-containing diguanylate cyclase [Anaerolineaceae bacterium]|nr:sensor domain-containing diguanylate cyclase [Anaerolineaceae bacterium]
MTNSMGNKNEEFYKGIIDNLYDGVYFVDRDRTITYWNNGAERITGYKAGQVMGLSCRDNLLNHVTGEGQALCQNGCPLSACMTDGVPREADVFLHHADGHRVPVLVRAAPMYDDDNKIIGAVETFSTDMGASSMRHELQELRQSMEMDKLTNIANRQFIDTRLHGMVAEQALRKNPSAGILFLDIDNFKNVNDTYGHDVGDKVLRMVAQTLNKNLRRSDVIGRWGGEEFLAILYDVNSDIAIRNVAEKLRMLVEFSRLDITEISLSVTISIGATMLSDSDTIESVVNRADQLMYTSKKAGRNQVTVG